MNIERTTSKGTAVTIIYNRGRYIHPCAKHVPEWTQLSSLSKIREAAEQNDKAFNARTTGSRAVAQGWADDIVNHFERVGI